MNIANYKILFSVYVYHSFYTNGKSDYWQFVPDSLTEKIIKKYRFAINRIDNGIELAINTSNVQNNILDYISTTTGLNAFRFRLQSDDNRIFMATEIPVNQVGKFRVSSKDQVDNDQNQDIQLKPIWEASPESGTYAEIIIDFDNLPDSLDSTEQPVFNISFTGRSTQWQYFVVNKSNLDFSNVQVVSKEGRTLIGPRMVKIQNGEQALEFYSGTDLLPLSDLPQITFNLVDGDTNGNGLNAANIIYKGLPNPNPDQFGLVNIEGDEVVTSPMYVYV